MEIASLNASFRTLRVLKTIYPGRQTRVVTDDRLRHMVSSMHANLGICVPYLYSSSERSDRNPGLSLESWRDKKPWERALIGDLDVWILKFSVAEGQGRGSQCNTQVTGYAPDQPSAIDRALASQWEPCKS